MRGFIHESGKVLITMATSLQSKQPKASISRCTSVVVALAEYLTGMFKPVITASSRVVLVPASTQLHGERAFNHHSTQISAYNIALDFG
ncbi:hypothetical protein ACOSQ2_004322 [Xanthoceras sorbifolium]